MAGQRLGGIIQIQTNGQVQLAKGDFTYNLGLPKNEAVMGVDAIHGHKSVPQVAFIEGEFTDYADLDLKALLTLKDATVTIALANGKTFALYDATYAGEGTVNTGEGNFPARFEGLTAEEF